MMTVTSFDVSDVVICRNGAVKHPLYAVLAVSKGSIGILSISLTMVYMLILEWRLALCVLVYNSVIRVFAVFVEKKIKQNSIDVTHAMRLSGNYLVSLLSNMLTVRIYSNRDFLSNQFKKKEQQVMKANWKSYAWSNGFQDFIWAFSKLAEFVIVYGVGSWLILRNVTDISILLAFVFANDLFTIGINDLSYYSTLRAESEAYQESLEVFLIESELEVGVHDIIFDKGIPIRFEDVSFSYKDKTVLKNVNFIIKAGEKILLQGENGSGKSTLLKLIAGLYRPDEGSIFYGDVDIATLHISCLAKAYGYISQHCNMLDGDVFTNIALDKKPNIEKVKKVLKHLNLSYIKNGSTKGLSQGEQQRLNIGRVLYGKKPIFIMGDEIFSNIDEGNRESIAKLLERTYKDETVIMVSHEQVNYRYDRVLTVCDGQVKEDLNG